MKRLVVTLCLLLCLLALWLVVRNVRLSDPAIAHASTPPRAVTQSVATPEPAYTSEKSKPSTRQPVRISTKGRVKLKPGESAVLSYWEIAPGMNGMALVTPEATDDGNIILKSRLLRFTDEAVRQISAEDMFPDIFDIEHYGAVGLRRVGEFLDAIQTSGGVDMLAMPTVLTRPGSPATISIGSSEQGELSLGLDAATLPDGGFDLGMTFERQEIKH